MSEFYLPTSDLIASEVMEVVEKFEHIPLEEVLEGAQMERVDRKYPFHISEVPKILEGLAGNYKIVNAAGSVVSPYDSLYFDTADYLFYRKHHNGFLNRDKIRYRSYPRTRTTFLEVKCKSNKGRTAKSRIECTDLKFPLKKDRMQFLSENISKIDPKTLVPSVFINYQRIAFISKEGNERFSLDFNISATLGNKETDFGNVVILEVKQDHKYTSPIIARLREMQIGEASMSKYCLTLAMLKPELKANRFKMNLRQLRKIIHEENH